MLALKNISYNIQHKVILDDVSVEFESGKLNLIIGPNGAGKSTLIKMISQQLRPHVGSVWYGDRDSTSISLGALARFRAVLSQNIDLAFPLTVAEVVMMGRYPHFTGKPASKDEEACHAAMQLFDIIDLAERNYLTLSGGEKQRVQFARVLAQIWYPLEGESRYLLLDEPLTFLDAYYQFDFMHKITVLLQQKDITMVGVVHDLNLAAKFADYIVLIHQGKVIAKGDRHTVLTKENIKRAFRLEPIIRTNAEGTYLYFN